MAYFSIINFFGGVESGLIWLKTGGFLKFYSGNTGRHEQTFVTSDNFKPASDADIPVLNAEVIRQVRGRVLPAPRCEYPQLRQEEG